MTCPRCQTPYQPGHAYCMSCGAPLTPSEVNAPHAQDAQEQELPETVMRRSPLPTPDAAPQNPPGEAYAPSAAAEAIPPDTAGAPGGDSAPRTMAVSGPQPTLYADLAAPPQPAPPATPYTPYPSQPPYAPSASQPYTPYPSQPYAPPATPYTPYPSQPYAPPDATIISSAPFSTPGSLPPYSAPPSYGSMPSYGSQPSYAPPAPQITGSGPVGGARAPSSPFLPDIFGLDADPLTARPRNALQTFLLRNVSQRYAVGKWFTAALGALVALAAGLLLTLVCQGLWGAAIGDVARSAGLGGSGLASYAQGALTPDLLRLFAVEHHVPLTASGTSG